MPGLVPGIHVLTVSPQRKTWMAGPSPAMTKNRSSNSGPADAKINSGTGVDPYRIFRGSGYDRGACRALFCLSWRTRTIRDREYALARRPAAAIRADPAV